MAEKKTTKTKKEEIMEGEDAELEAAADKFLAEADDLIEPFTLIELPPEGAPKKKSTKKSSRSKAKDAADSAEAAPEKTPEEVLAALLEKGKKTGQLTNKELEVLANSEKALSDYINIIRAERAAASAQDDLRSYAENMRNKKGYGG